MEILIISTQNDQIHFLLKSIFNNLKKEKQCIVMKDLACFKGNIIKGIDIKLLKQKKFDLQHIPKHNH